ncbi:DUF177 domain-containing protein [soil metagenome]
MKREFTPARLDINAFAEAAATLSATDPLHNYRRLSAELAVPAPEATVRWEAQGDDRGGADGSTLAWLHLQAATTLPLVCQRCLSPVETTLQIDRWFRFAADEETAAAEDELSDEDVLVTSREFDLQALIEDELLMDIPITPTHEVCPEPVQLSAVDPAFEVAQEARPNPFAVLGSLRPRKPE